MEEIVFNEYKQVNEVKKSKEFLEEKLGVRITITGPKIVFEGPPMKEYESSLVFEAIAHGFSAKKAVQLKSHEYVFRRLIIKDFTRRKNLKDVKSRIIGTEGKTRRTLENLSDCDILITESAVGIIANADNIDEATTAVQNLIRGSKQANVYKYLEKRNVQRRQRDTDLGIKDKKLKANSNL